MTRLWIVAAAALAALPASADRLTLKDGGVCEGRVIAETEREITLEVLLSGKIVRIGLPVDRVAARDRTPSVLDAYEAEWAKSDPKSADAHENLAAWCLERKWVERAETHLRAAILRAPDHALAGRLAKSMGWTREGDRWQTEAERMQAQGLEKADDRWVTKEESTRLRQEDSDRRQESARATDRQGVEYHLKRAEAALSDARKELDRARESTAQAEDRKLELETQRKSLMDRVEGLKAREEAVRFEIERVEAWLRLRTPCDCQDMSQCPHDPARAQAFLEAAYKQLSRVRRERREAERELSSLNDSILTQGLVIKARRETMGKAEQAALWRAAEVDRLKTKLTALR